MEQQYASPNPNDDMEPGLEIKDAEIEKVDGKTTQEIMAETDDSFMDLFTALREVKDGKKIHKLEWHDRAFYAYLNKGVLTLHRDDGKEYQWVLSEGDMTGNDYITVE